MAHNWCFYLLAVNEIRAEGARQHDPKGVSHQWLAINRRATIEVARQNTDFDYCQTHAVQSSPFCPVGLLEEQNRTLKTEAVCSENLPWDRPAGLKNVTLQKLA